MSQSQEKQELVIKRVLDIPIELVWKGWTDPKMVMLWWGPKHFTSPSCELDLREGGRYLFCMRAPKEFGSQDYYSAGVYMKIIPLERLELTQILADKDGNLVDPVQVGMPADFPKEIKMVIEFKALGDQTELTITEFGWTPGPLSDNSVAGMNQSLDKFAASIGSLPR